MEIYPLDNMPGDGSAYRITKDDLKVLGKIMYEDGNGGGIAIDTGMLYLSEISLEVWPFIEEPDE